MDKFIIRLAKQSVIFTWKVVTIILSVIFGFESDQSKNSADVPEPDVYPWDASRAADPKYYDDANAAGIAWNYYNSSKPDEIDWDLR